MALDPLTSIIADGVKDLNTNNFKKPDWHGLEFWSGTQEEYDALGEYSDSTLYFITGGEEEAAEETVQPKKISITEDDIIQDAAQEFDEENVLRVTSLPLTSIIDDSNEISNEVIIPPSELSEPFPDTPALEDITVNGSARILSFYNPEADRNLLYKPDQYLAYKPRYVSVVFGFKYDGTYELYSWQYANGVSPDPLGGKINRVVYATGRWLEKVPVEGESYNLSLELLEINGKPIPYSRTIKQWEDTNPDCTNVDGIDYFLGTSYGGTKLSYTITPGSETKWAQGNWSMRFHEHSKNWGTKIWYADSMHLDPTIPLSGSCKLRVSVSGKTVVGGTASRDLNININFAGGEERDISPSAPLVFFNTDPLSASDPLEDRIRWWGLAISKPAVLNQGLSTSVGINQTLYVDPGQQVTFYHGLHSYGRVVVILGDSGTPDSELSSRYAIINGTPTQTRAIAGSERHQGGYLVDYNEEYETMVFPAGVETNIELNGVYSGGLYDKIDYNDPDSVKWDFGAGAKGNDKRFYLYQVPPYGTVDDLNNLTRPLGSILIPYFGELGDLPSTTSTPTDPSDWYSPDGSPKFYIPVWPKSRAENPTNVDAIGQDKDYIPEDQWVALVDEAGKVFYQSQVDADLADSTGWVETGWHAFDPGEEKVLTVDPNAFSGQDISVTIRTTMRIYLYGVLKPVSYSRKALIKVR